MTNQQSSRLRYAILTGINSQGQIHETLAKLYLIVLDISYFDLFHSQTLESPRLSKGAQLDLTNDHFIDDD